MAGFSRYLAEKTLNHLLRADSLAKPATVYVALHTADPTRDDLTATELPIGSGGYARLALAVANATWSAPASAGAQSVVANAATLNFGSASADLGTVTHFSLRDAATGGNLLIFGPVDAPRTILDGDPIVINAGALTVGIAG